MPLLSTRAHDETLVVTKRQQRETYEDAALVAVYRAAERVVRDGERVEAGVYRVNPAAWLALRSTLVEARRRMGER